MKYAKALKCLYYVGRCSKYLYYAKKILCVVFFVIAAALGVGLLFNGKCFCKKLREIV